MLAEPKYPRHIRHVDYRLWKKAEWREFAKLINLPDYAETMATNFQSKIQLEKIQQQYLCHMGIHKYDDQVSIMRHLNFLFSGSHPIQKSVLELKICQFIYRQKLEERLKKLPKRLVSEDVELTNEIRKISQVLSNIKASLDDFTSFLNYLSDKQAAEALSLPDPSSPPPVASDSPVDSEEVADPNSNPGEALSEGEVAAEEFASSSESDDTPMVDLKEQERKADEEKKEELIKKFEQQCEALYEQVKSFEGLLINEKKCSKNVLAVARSCIDSLLRRVVATQPLIWEGMRHHAFSSLEDSSVVAEIPSDLLEEGDFPNASAALLIKLMDQMMLGNRKKLSKMIRDFHKYEGEEVDLGEDEKDFVEEKGPIKCSREDLAAAEERERRETITEEEEAEKATVDAVTPVAPLASAKAETQTLLGHEIKKEVEGDRFPRKSPIAIRNTEDEANKANVDQRDSLISASVEEMDRTRKYDDTVTNGKIEITVISTQSRPSERAKYIHNSGERQMREEKIMEGVAAKEIRPEEGLNHSSFSEKTKVFLMRSFTEESLACDVIEEIFKCASLDSMQMSPCNGEIQTDWSEEISQHTVRLLVHTAKEIMETSSFMLGNQKEVSQRSNYSNVNVITETNFFPPK